MSLFDRALVAIGFKSAAEPAAPTPASTTITVMREAAGTTVDRDDADWKRLTGASHKDLSPITQERMLQLTQHLWESNPLANRLIELPLAYLLGKGVRLVIADEDSQNALDRHWRDSINAWPIKLIKRARELAMFGEQCWPVFVGGNGFVRVGYLDPKRIETVVMDPDNAEQPIGVVTRRDAKGRKKKYRVIINGPESAFTKETQAIRQDFADGDCFFFRINDLCNGTRGRGDLLPLLDWLDAYDEFLFGELDRADFMRAFVWDVTIQGATQQDVEARARTIQAPRPGSVRVHNENETWDAVSPELQAGDGATASRTFRNHVLGGNTMPEHWYGGGGDVNRSTAGSMAEPTEKVYEMRQTYLGHVLQEVATFVLRAHWKLLDSADELDATHQELLDSLKVEWPEMTAKDTSRYAAAFQQVVTATATAMEDGQMTRKTALSLIAVFAKQLGVEFDVDKELAQAQAELKARKAEDSYTEPTLDDEDVEDDDAQGADRNPPPPPEA